MKEAATDSTLCDAYQQLFGIDIRQCAHFGILERTTAILEMDYEEIHLTTNSPKTYALIVEGIRPSLKVAIRKELTGIDGRSGCFYIFFSPLEFQQLFDNGSVFYSVHCAAGRLVYSRPDFRLPSATWELVRSRFLKAFPQFNSSHQRSRAFLDGAKFYIGTDQVEMAAFMLHQSLELMFTGMEIMLLAKPKKSHKIGSHFKLSGMIAPTLCGCFGERDSLSSILPGIERAYLNVRYKSSFHISGEEVDLLITKTENAQHEARRLVLVYGNLLFPDLSAAPLPDFRKPCPGYAGD